MLRDYRPELGHGFVFALHSDACFWPRMLAPGLFEMLLPTIVLGAADSGAVILEKNRVLELFDIYHELYILVAY